MAQITVGKDGDGLILIVVEDGLVHNRVAITLDKPVKGLILIVVEDGLVHNRVAITLDKPVKGLILIVVEDGLVLAMATDPTNQQFGLILIVVEDGLVRRLMQCLKVSSVRLNPYCSGRWPRTLADEIDFIDASNGGLILIVVEDGLVLDLIRHY